MKCFSSIIRSQCLLALGSHSFFYKIPVGLIVSGLIYKSHSLCYHKMFSSLIHLSVRLPLLRRVPDDGCLLLECTAEHWPTVKHTWVCPAIWWMTLQLAVGSMRRVCVCARTRLHMSGQGGGGGGVGGGLRRAGTFCWAGNPIKFPQPHTHTHTHTHTDTYLS